MIAESKTIGGTAVVPPKTSDAHRAPLQNASAHITNAPRDSPAQKFRRDMSTCSNAPQARRAPDFPERISISPQPILDCATSGRKILSANVAGRRRVRAVPSTAHSSAISLMPRDSLALHRARRMHEGDPASARKRRSIRRGQDLAWQI